MDYSLYMCPWTAEDLAAARSDGKMEYTTIRNDDPAKQDELNIPSASLQPVS